MVEYNNRFSKDPLSPRKKRFSLEKALLIGFLLFFVGSLAYNHYIQNQIGEDKLATKSGSSIPTKEIPDVISSQGNVPAVEEQKERVDTDRVESVDAASHIEYDNLSTSDILERISHQSAVEQARRVGVSTKGSTSDILERISHQSAVEQARRAGVSAEGSTSDILERISHQSAVEQARRAGVSAEGSTSDILERISHQSAVEQARRAGVSAEGSTSDILERISRKTLERYGF